VGVVIYKNAFCEGSGVGIIDLRFDLIEHKAVSLVIGVIDRGKETDVAGGTGD